MGYIMNNSGLESHIPAQSSTQQVMDIVNSGWFGISITVILFTFSLAVALYIYKKTRLVSRLRIIIGSAPIIGLSQNNHPNGLEIRFNEAPVPRVTSTSFGIWNDGGSTFRNIDIVDSDPTRLICDREGQILRVSIEEMSRPVIMAEIVLNNSQDASLGFKFLDPGDGFRVQIIHSGTISSITYAGTIIGLPTGVTYYEPSVIPRIVMGIWFLLLMASLILPTIRGIITILKENGTQATILSLVPTITGVLSLYIARKTVLNFKTGGYRIKGVPEIITNDALLFAKSNWPADN